MNMSNYYDLTHEEYISHLEHNVNMYKSAIHRHQRIKEKEDTQAWKEKFGYSPSEEMIEDYEEKLNKAEEKLEEGKNNPSLTIRIWKNQ